MQSVAVPRVGRLIAVSTSGDQVALFTTDPLWFSALLTPEEKPRPLDPDRVFDASPIAFAPDASRVVCALPRELVLWDVATRTARFHLRLDARPLDLAFFPDGASFVSVGPRAERRASDTGAVAAEYELPAGTNATAVAVAHDGRHVLVGLDRGEIVEYETATRRAERRFLGHEDPVTGLAYAPDDSRFVSTTARCDLTVWWVANPGRTFWRVRDSIDWWSSRASTRPSEDAIDALAFAFGGSQSLFRSGLLDPFDLVPRGTLSRIPARVAWSPDGRRVALAAHTQQTQGNAALVLDLVDGELWTASNLYGCTIVFTADSRFVLTPGCGAPEVWDAETGTYLDP